MRAPRQSVEKAKADVARERLRIFLETGVLIRDDGRVECFGDQARPQLEPLPSIHGTPCRAQ